MPTPRALAVQERLHRLIEEAQALVASGREVELGGLERTFTLRANDALTALLAAPLVARVLAVAPGVTLRFVAEGEEDLAPLRDGLIDLDLGVIEGFGPEVRARPPRRERLVGLAAPGHPLGDGRPRWRASPRSTTSPSRAAAGPAGPSTKCWTGPGWPARSPRWCPRTPPPHTSSSAPS